MASPASSWKRTWSCAGSTQLEQGGVEFVLNCDVGKDITFEEIRSKHNAVMIATGVYKSRNLTGPGVGADGIVRAIDFLTASNRWALAMMCRNSTAAS